MDGSIRSSGIRPVLTIVHEEKVKEVAGRPGTDRPVVSGAR
jgi:hypothetical protein